MVSADDERLLGLIAAARGRFGDDMLGDPARLVPFLTDQAPDLRPRIRAVAAALAAQAPAVLRADPLGADRLAARIAAESGIDQAQARDGIALAVRIGGGPGPAAPPPVPAADWVGLSSPAGAAVPAPVGPAGAGLPGLLRNRWVLGGAACLAVLYFIQLSQTPAPVPAPAPSSGPSPQAGPPAAPGPHAGGGGGLPLLTPNPAQAGPVIPVSSGPDGTQLDFGVPVTNGALHGIILISPQGWESALVGFARPGAAQPGTVSSKAGFVLSAGQNGTARVMRPAWTRDEVGAGAICVVFWQASGADVALHGSRMCLLEFANKDCSKVIGCGTVE